MAPLIKVSPTSAAPGDIALTITCTPRLLPDQEPHTNLLFGAQPIQPDSIMTPADPLQPTTLEFTRRPSSRVVMLSVCAWKALTAFQ